MFSRHLQNETCFQPSDFISINKTLSNEMEFAVAYASLNTVVGNKPVSDCVRGWLNGLSIYMRF